MRDFTLPGDDLDDVGIPEYAADAESLVDALRKSISQPGTFPLLAALVRTAMEKHASSK